MGGGQKSQKIDDVFYERPKSVNSPNHSLSFFRRLLRALALSDLCVMFTGILLYGMPGISSTYKCKIQPMISPYLLPIAQTSIMTSVYLAVLMSFERYIRICFTCQLRPFRCITSKNLM